MCEVQIKKEEINSILCYNFIYRGDRLMNEKIIKVFPESGQKKVLLVNNEKYGGLCIKKVQKDISFISRLKKEVNIQKELNCIYFPKVYYAEINESKCLIYEEYIEGDDLTKFIGKKSKFYNNETECLKILKELVIALSYVWDKNIVHRDIKPANIIIRSSNLKPVILDLGIAKNLNSKSVTQGAMWGTPGYSSPEQSFNKRDLFGKKSDMFSLGVVIYELFYSERPFRDVYDAAMVPCNFNKNNLQPSEEFKKIITKLLEKMPYNRYKNADTIIQEINKVIGGE